MEKNELADLIGVNITKYITPSLIVIGLILNPICFIIYSRKPFQKVATAFYLRVLSVTDCMAIVPGITIFLKHSRTFDMDSLNDISCKITNYLLYAPIASSAWLEAVVSIDRAFSVAFPNKFKLRETRRFQWSVTLLVLIYNYLYYVQSLVFYKIQASDTEPGDAENSTSYLNMLHWGMPELIHINRQTKTYFILIYFNFNLLIRIKISNLKFFCFNITIINMRSFKLKR